MVIKIKLNKNQMETVLLALGVFSKELIEEQKDWHEELYDFEFESNSYDINKLSLEIYGKILSELTGQKF